jgi:predicted transcriptional regulator
MKTISLRIDDEIDAALASLCAEQGRNETEVQDPALAQLYEELAAEDQALAEESMSEYQQTLRESDER